MDEHDSSEVMVNGEAMTNWRAFAVANFAVGKKCKDLGGGRSFKKTGAHFFVVCQAKGTTVPKDGTKAEQTLYEFITTCVRACVRVCLRASS